MDFAALIARMDQQRTQWVALPDAKRVQFMRPLETDFARFRAGVSVELICECVCGWEGFSEADLLGAAIGSSDPLPFDAALWTRVARDRIEYMPPIAEALVTSITEHLKAKDDVAKN